MNEHTPQLSPDHSKDTSLKPYLTACAVQALPIIAWAVRPSLFGETGTGEPFLRLLAWSYAASFTAGAIIGAFRVRKLPQTVKCLIPILIIGALAALVQSGARSEIAIYLISQGPGAIFGGTVGAFTAGNLVAMRKSRP
jgi:hypothetical protein